MGFLQSAPGALLDSANTWTQNQIIADNVLLLFGNDSDIAFLNNSAGLSADEELAGVIEGTSNHQGIAANSLIISNITNDGDIMLLVSDGGNSLEFLLADADVAFLHLGFGMINTTIYASGDITLDSSAGSINFALQATDADAFEANDGTTAYYLINTVIGTDGTVAHQWDRTNGAMASGINENQGLAEFLAWTMAYTGNTTIAAGMNSVEFRPVTYTSDTATLQINRAETIHITPPIEGSNVNLLDAVAINIGNADSGTPGDQIGIFMGLLTRGATRNLAFSIENDIEFRTAINIQGTTSVTFNDDGSDVDHIFEGANNTLLVSLDAALDNIGLGGAVNAAAFLRITPGAQNRALQTSIGWGIDLVADTITSSNTDTDAIGAYAFFGTPTLAAASATYTATIAATVYIEAAPVVGSNAAIGTPLALFVDAGNSRFDGRVLEGQGADIASGDEIALGNDGNYFDITGSTTINHITKTGWQAGAVLFLQFDASVTVTHNSGSPTGTEASLLLAGAGDFSATAGDTLTLVYDGTTFRELARTVI